MKENPIFQYTKPFTNESQALEIVRTHFKQQQHCYGVNCWHLNEVESVAMWKLYTSGNDGIAIQTTVGRLKACLSNEPRDIFIAEVQYCDYDALHTLESMEADTLTPLITKRRSYRHECEVRVILDRRPADDPNVELGMILGIGHKGEPLHVDVSALIERIVVAERFPDWTIESLQAEASAKGVSVTIESSDLLKTPRVDDEHRTNS